MRQKSGGEFLVRNKDGGSVWIPNTFTKAGVKALLQSAFWHSGPTWEVGLCANPPAEMIALGDLEEPTATNGYARVQLPFTNANWPVVNEVVGQVYVQSTMITFPLTGPISTAVNRLFITDGTEVIAISSPLPEALGELLLLDDEYNTTYRFYMR